MMVNGAIHAFPDKRPMPPASCAFCDGEAQLVHFEPGPGEARQSMYGCPSCGSMGPPANDEARALTAWNQRAKDDPATLAIGHSTPPETCAAAAALLEVVKGLYANRLGTMKAFALVLLDPTAVQQKFGVVIHALDPMNAGALFVMARNHLIQSAVEQKTPGGIVIPKGSEL